MDDLSSRFLDSFAAIEQWMRNQVPATKWLDFPELVECISRTNYSVRRHNAVLKELSRVRNLLVHHYNRKKPIAVPTDHAVGQITAIRDELVSPPSLISVSASPVEQCCPTDRLGSSVKKMHDGLFSQLPIYEGQNCLGLLTAETIARWLANHLADGVGLIEESSVSDVVEHQDDHENHTFIDRNASVTEGLDAFDDFLHRGKRLEAILITHSGCNSEKPLGIVTIYDIPKMRRTIQE